MQRSLLFLPLFLGLFLQSCTFSGSSVTSSGGVDQNPYPTIGSGSEEVVAQTQGSNFSGSGEEPTWSMTLADTGITVTVSESGSTLEYPFVITQSVTGDTILVRDGKGELYGKLEKKLCGTGSTTQPYTASISFMQFELKGCANPQ